MRVENVYACVCFWVHKCAWLFRCVCACVYVVKVDSSFLSTICFPMSQIVGILPINKWIKENASKINIKIHKKRHSSHRLIEHPLRTIKDPSGRLCKHIDYYGWRHGSRKNLLSIRLLSQLTSLKIDFAVVTSGIGFCDVSARWQFLFKIFEFKETFFSFFLNKDLCINISVRVCEFVLEKSRKSLILLLMQTSYLHAIPEGRWR